MSEIQDDSLIIYKTNERLLYTTIDLTCVLDKRLSWKAKGLHLYLMSRPPNWKIWMNDLINKSTNGRDSIRNALKELEKYKYVYRKQIREPDGRMMGSKYLVFDKPFNNNPNELDQILKEVLPEPGFPATDNPATDNPPHSNKDYSNKEESKDNKEPKGSLFSSEPTLTNSEGKSENILMHWNRCVKDIKDMSVHKSINSKHKFLVKPINVSGPLPAVCTIHNIIRSINVDDVDMIFAISNYITVLESSEHWYSVKFKTLAEFITSKVFMTFLSDENPINFYRDSAYSCPDDTVWDKMRKNIKFITLEYNYKKPLDIDADTYLGVAKNICENRDIKHHIHTLGYYMSGRNEGMDMGVKQFQIIEECMVALIFRKRVEDIELLEKLHELWKKWKDILKEELWGFVKE